MSKSERQAETIEKYGVVCIHTLLTVHLAGPSPIKLLWKCYMNSHSATNGNVTSLTSHDDVIKWKHFARYWPFVYSPHKGQWRGALMFFFICPWTNGWGNNRYDGDFRRHRAHCNVTVIIPSVSPTLAIDYVRQLLCVLRCGVYKKRFRYQIENILSQSITEWWD